MLENFNFLASTPGVPDVVGLLFPNLPNFIAHILASIVIIVFLSKVAYKPFRQAIDKRRERIDHDLNEAILKQSTANRDLKAAAECLKTAKIESATLMSAALQEVEGQKAEILTQATMEANNLKESATKAMTHERLKAEAEIYETIVNVAFQAAAQVLETELDEAKDKKMIRDFIDNLDKDQI